jgi:prepilin-type N-terminal cleavage/methylation domain-containing protein
MKTSRSGFTLVEILVVITIIGLVAAIALPAIGQALARARNAAIKTEIDMLHMAVMNYRNEYGSFPPSGTTNFTGTDPASRHLLRLFPRLTTVSATFQLASLAYINSGTGPLLTMSVMTPGNALPLWLHGYTTDPLQPILTATSAPNLSRVPRRKMYDFDTTRISTGTATPVYFPPSKPASPYIYINSSAYSAAAWPVATAFTYQVRTTSGTTNYSIAAGTYSAQVNTVTGNFFNPDTFQILSAGRDEVWNTDDDLSNFWPGTRQDFTDNLSN